MKNSLLLLSILALMLYGCNGELFVGTSEGDNVLNFASDPVFNEYCKTFDTNYDGELSASEMEAVYRIDLTSLSTYSEVASLEGIEHFVNLSYLNCTGTKVTNLDVSANTKLTTLRCSDTELTTLDVSNNTELEVLYCNSTLLTSLDISANTKLTTLGCSSIGLTTLDISNNPRLERLWCNDNQLTTLSLSANTALTHLYCYNNQLTTLDLSASTELAQLHCYDNQLATLNISTCTALTYLAATGNPSIVIYVWASFNTADPKSEFSYIDIDDTSVFTI